MPLTGLCCWAIRNCGSGCSVVNRQAGCCLEPAVRLQVLQQGGAGQTAAPIPPCTRRLAQQKGSSYPCAPAGVMGAKQTAALIPLCHNIFLTKVNVRATLQQESCSLLIAAEASTTSETGTGYGPLRQ